MNRAMAIVVAVALVLIFIGVAFWVADRAAETIACASSMMVEIGKEPVANPTTCIGVGS